MATHEPFLARARRAWRTLRGTQQTRGYNGATAGRLYSDWFAAATSGDAEIRASFRKLLDRSRDLARNNDYMRGYLGDCEDNIVGAIKYDLRMDCGEYVPAKGAKEPKWQPDRSANRLIETAWANWGKRGTCTVCGRYSWRDVKRLAVRTVPQDGNFIVRKVRGAAAGNAFNFALQVWEVDHLDLQLFTTLRNGNEIRFGIEYNSMKRPVAYWLKATNPGDLAVGATETPATRFPASDIYHLYVAERSEQSIGVPWVVSAITRLRQLGAFEEAATVAARLGASNAVFFTKTGDAAGEWQGDITTDGRAIMDVEPGTAQELPANWNIASHKPPYPNIETGDFRKAMLRGIATSLGTSYTTLGNDLESVNFSSARVGLFDERETWKKHQLFFDECFNEPVFTDWLEAAIAADAVHLPMGRFEKFNRPVFKARRWPFIDPLKEVEAAKTAIALRIGSRRQFIEEGGGDVEEVFHANKDDETLAEDIGLSLAPPDPMPEAFGDLTAKGGGVSDSEEDGAKPPKMKAVG